jgi:hypothetical protein
LLNRAFHSSAVVDPFTFIAVSLAYWGLQPERRRQMKKIAIALAAGALALPAAPAAADPPPWAPAYGKRAKDRDYRDSRYRDRDRRYYRETRADRRLYRGDRVWRGRDGRYYCERDNGTTGLVIGAGVGALAGAEIAGNGSRTLGAIIGAIGGGLLGREVDRGDIKCR